MTFDIIIITVITTSCHNDAADHGDDEAAQHRPHDGTAFKGMGPGVITRQNAQNQQHASPVDRAFQGHGPTDFAHFVQTPR